MMRSFLLFLKLWLKASRLPVAYPMVGIPLLIGQLLSLLFTKQSISLYYWLVMHVHGCFYQSFI